MKSGYKVLVFFISFYVVFAINTFSAENAGLIMKKTEKTLKGMSTLNCSFERQYIVNGSGGGTPITGTISLKKPYKLRVEYSGQTIVVDGENVWVYIPRNNQVQISKFVSDSETFPTPESIFRKYSQNSEAALAGTENINGSICDILSLKSKGAAQKEIKVWIDRKLNFPVKSLEKGPSGETSVYVLKDVVINGKTDPKKFVFTPPKGAEIVDMRE